MNTNPPNAAHAETPRPTPRTDEAIRTHAYNTGGRDHIHAYVDPEEMRQLETELQAERLRGAEFAAALMSIKCRIYEAESFHSSNRWTLGELIGVLLDENAEAFEKASHITAHAEGKHQAI